jgi:hypothetical protein
MPTPNKLFFFPCSLCGESRKDPTHVRSHRFKTSENENAQRYPLCNYCLGRVRSTCDYLGFLRVLKDGHWRADGQESERAAWEESVRLREQMFWCRVGGGVVPAVSHSHGDASRHHGASEGEQREQEEKLSEELDQTGEIQPRDVTPLVEQPPLLTPDAASTTAGDDAGPSKTARSDEAVDQRDDKLDAEARNPKRGSSPSVYSLQNEPTKEDHGVGSPRLSITIPAHPE